MRIGAMELFKRINCSDGPTDSFLIFGWHWKKSITWRISLTWSPKTSQYTNRGFYWHKNNTNRIFAGFNSKFIGDWNLSTQQNMWRDL